MSQRHIGGCSQSINHRRINHNPNQYSQAILVSNKAMFHGESTSSVSHKLLQPWITVNSRDANHCRSIDATSEALRALKVVIKPFVFRMPESEDASNKAVLIQRIRRPQTALFPFETKIRNKITKYWRPNSCANPPHARNATQTPSKLIYSTSLASFLPQYVLQLFLLG